METYKDKVIEISKNLMKVHTIPRVLRKIPGQGKEKKGERS